MPQKKAVNKSSSRAILPLSDVLSDYRIGYISRVVSLVGRKEVLSGKAKFGIFGDGKEVAQLAMARSFRHGDWRSGYYRDQTFMFSLNALSVRQFFAQLFADTNVEHEPSSGGRQMNSHFASRFLDDDGHWLNQLVMYNTTSDASPTACQMPRLLGLAYASKLYREIPLLKDQKKFSINGSEIAFGTIGNASTSEGLFWETLNAAGVLQVPMLLSVWDDGYGISVPNEYQTTKGSISKACLGFHPKGGQGVLIHEVKGWDYPLLVDTYQKIAEKMRKDHTPALVHVTELTQPQGHSTSGSHERYKSEERLSYEKDMDCLTKMREWMLGEGLARESELAQIEEEAQEYVEKEKKAAWEDYQGPLLEERNQLLFVLGELDPKIKDEALGAAILKLEKAPSLTRRTILSTARQLLVELYKTPMEDKLPLIDFASRYHVENNDRYSSHLLCENTRSPIAIDEIPPQYSDSPEVVDGRLVIQRVFDYHLGEDPRLFIIGEDVGALGGVNLEFDGLQKKYGELRVTDTGIREASILGQGIGTAVRGLRPVVDIQYLDYLLYAFQTMSDDLATLHYRSAGGQIAPVIVRTKGDRLEGVWHTGSPMGTIINGLRGIHICVPRDMVQAAGMYNTLLLGDDPALVIEVLNGYRLKEALPDNLFQFRVPLGVPEVLIEGEDLTMVTYGACINIAKEAIKKLNKVGVGVELIDIRTLLPFDLRGIIVNSLKKTGAVLFVDEDVPGGSSAFMMQQVLEDQGGYDFLDAMPRTLSSQPHRGAYASDGDYFSKPNADDMFDFAYSIVHARDPATFPAIRD